MAGHRTLAPLAHPAPIRGPPQAHQTHAVDDGQAPADELELRWVGDDGVAGHVDGGAARLGRRGPPLQLVQVLGEDGHERLRLRLRRALLRALLLLPVRLEVGLGHGDPLDARRAVRVAPLVRVRHGHAHNLLALRVDKLLHADCAWGCRDGRRARRAAEQQPRTSHASSGAACAAAAASAASGVDAASPLMGPRSCVPLGPACPRSAQGSRAAGAGALMAVHALRVHPDDGGSSVVLLISGDPSWRRSAKAAPRDARCR